MPYQTREEEAAGLTTTLEVRRNERKENEERMDRQLIADAKDKGFRDCNEVFDYPGDSCD